MIKQRREQGPFRPLGRSPQCNPGEKQRGFSHGLFARIPIAQSKMIKQRREQGPFRPLGRSPQTNPGEKQRGFSRGLFARIPIAQSKMIKQRREQGPFSPLGRSPQCNLAKSIAALAAGLSSLEQQARIAWIRYPQIHKWLPARSLIAAFMSKNRKFSRMRRYT